MAEQTALASRVKRKSTTWEGIGMTTQTRPKSERTQPQAKLPTRRRFTLDEYERMIARDIIHEGERVELLGGEILCMAAMGGRHTNTLDRLNFRFVRALDEDVAVVRVQEPIRLVP